MEADGTNNADGGVEHLSFEVGGQSYAVDIKKVREIRGWTEPSGMPNTEPDVMGVIKLRGEFLPLFDLAAKLGLKSPEINERSVIIVVEADDTVVGFLVDSVSNIITPAPEDMKNAPEAAKDSDVCYVSAITLLDEKLTRILDPSALLSAAEQVFDEVS